MARSRSPRKKRPEMTPGAIRGFGWFFAVLSLLAAAGVWWLAAVYSHQRSQLAAFEAAPVCSASAGTSGSCREVLAAVVQDSAFRGGGGKGGGSTAIDLAPTSGGLITTRFTQASAPEAGEMVTVTVWRGKPMLIQPADRGRTAIATLASPQWGVENDATGILVLMAFVLGLGAAAWGFLTYFAMGRRRAAPVHVVAAAMFAAVVTLRIRNDYGALATVAYVVPPVFLALTIGWLLLVRARFGLASGTS